MGNACESYCSYEEQNQLQFAQKNEFRTEKLQPPQNAGFENASNMYSSLSATKKSKKTIAKSNQAMSK